MSQVKNLRAMFENKGDSSPPDRGRSPSIPLSRKQNDGTSPGGSPRPLSKVRTNFVAVEKDGRLGLTRDRSDESRTSTRRPYPEAGNKPRNNTREHEKETTLLEDIAVMSTKELSLPDTAVAPCISPGEQAVVAESAATDISETTTATQSNRERDITLRDEDARELRALSHAKETKPGNHSKCHTNANLNTYPSIVTEIGHTMAVSGAFSVESKATTRKSSESKAFVNEPKVAAAAVGSSSRAKVNPLSSSAPRKRQMAGARHQTVNNLKHKPKPIAQPVHLPSSVMAPTASSTSKVHGPQSSHQNRPGTKPTISTSLASHAKPDSGSVSSTSVIKQRHASLSSPRPSLGPPPSKSLPSSATTKRPSNIDDSFLARVTRPTRSSASKFSDKVPLTSYKTSTQPLIKRKDSGPSDRGSTRSVSSRYSPACKFSTIEISDRSPPSIIEDIHVGQVTDGCGHTRKNNNQEREGTVVETTPQKCASEDAPRIMLGKDSVCGTSTINFARDSSEMEQLRDGVESYRQSCVLDKESISVSKDTQPSRTSELTLLQASILSAVPERATNDVDNVLAPVNDQKPSFDEVLTYQTKIENTEVEKDLDKRTVNTTYIISEGENQSR
ncbi:hypothetical protein E4U21_005489 [Claviceps maximensis]|nr:hypothetical protein E4U21_005489 [Claviceps maximensis]